MSNTCFYCNEDAEFICPYHIKKMLEALSQMRNIAQAAIDAAEGKE